MSASKRSNSKFGMGFLRPFAAVIVLTAFILAITFTVRGINSLQAADLLKITRPLLAKINIKLPDNKIGQVAGSMAARISNSNLSGGGSVERVVVADAATQEAPDAGFSGSEVSSIETDKSDSTKEEVFSVAVLADSHSDYPNLTKALDIVEAKGIGTVFFLGDFTKLGLVEDLVAARKIMDSADVTYYAISGDHDLWKSVGHDNYVEVFGKSNRTVVIDNTKFLFLDNSANYTVVDAADMAWFKKEVKDADFVLLSQPLYYPRLDRYMGRIDGEDVAELLAQRNDLLDTIRQASVKAVIAADLHTSDSIEDPDKKGLRHILVGALTSERNLQSPRFSVFKQFKDSSYELQDVVLE